jgi:hypothetical protein
MKGDINVVSEVGKGTTFTFFVELDDSKDYSEEGDANDHDVTYDTLENE